MTVVDIPGGDSDHRALVVSLRVRVTLAAPAAVTPTLRAAVVRLTPAEATSFRSSEWEPVLDAVEAVLAEGVGSVTRSERALAVFEEGVVARLAAARDCPPASIGVARRRGATCGRG